MPIVLRGRAPLTVESTYDPNRYLVDGGTAAIKTLSKSICCFIPTAHLEESTGLGGSLKLATVRTDDPGLDNEERYRATALNVVERKKKALLEELNPTDSELDSMRRQVESLPWPNFRNDATTNRVTVSMRPDIKNQVAPGLATGFAIRRGLVVTAAHVVRRFFEGGTGNALAGTKVVFGFSNNDDPYIAWDIKRIIHSTQATVVGVSGSPTSLLEDPRLHYPDFAVLELDVPDEVSFPPPLVLQKYPASEDTPVHAIGHPGGLPLIGVRGGKVVQSTPVTRNSHENHAVNQ